MKIKPKSVLEYISSYSGIARERLQMIYKVVQKQAAEAEESISYGMPAFKLAGKPLIYFAGYEKHIGLYALPSGHKQFSKELAGYKQGKGSVQFPHNRPLPVELIKKIVKFRIQEKLDNVKQLKKPKVKSVKRPSPKTIVKQKNK